MIISEINMWCIVTMTEYFVVCSYRLPQETKFKNVNECLFVTIVYSKWMSLLRAVVFFYPTGVYISTCRL